MKNNINILILFVLTTMYVLPIYAFGQENQTLLNPLVSYSFSDNLDDDANTGKPLIEHGSVTFTSDRFGNPKSSCRLDPDSYLQIPSDVIQGKLIKTKGYSFSFWINFKGPTATKDFNIFGIKEVSSVHPLVGMTLHGSDVIVNMESTVKKGTPWNLWFWDMANLYMRPPDWYHVVLTYTNNSMSIYIANKDESINEFYRHNYLWPPDLPNSIEGIIGKLGDEAISNLDDFKIFASPLNRQEVNILHNMESGKFSHEIAYKIIDFFGEAVSAPGWTPNGVIRSQTYNGNDHQLWRIVELEPNQYVICNEWDVYYLGLTGVTAIANPYSGPVAGEETEGPLISLDISKMKSNEITSQIKIGSRYFVKNYNDQYVGTGDSGASQAWRSIFTFVPVKYTTFKEGEHLVRLRLPPAQNDNNRSIDRRSDPVKLSIYDPDQSSNYHFSISTNNDDKGFVIRNVINNKVLTSNVSWGGVVDMASFNPDDPNQRWYVHVVGYDNKKPKYRIVSKSCFLGRNRVQVLGYSPSEPNLLSTNIYNGPNTRQTIWEINKVMYGDPMEGHDGDLVDIKSLNTGHWVAFREAPLKWALYLNDWPYANTKWKINRPGSEEYKGYQQFISNPNGLGNKTNRPARAEDYSASINFGDVSVYEGATTLDDYTTWKLQWTGYDDNMNPYYRISLKANPNKCWSEYNNKYIQWNSFQDLSTQRFTTWNNRPGIATQRQIETIAMEGVKELIPEINDYPHPTQEAEVSPYDTTGSALAAEKAVVETRAEQDIKAMAPIESFKIHPNPSDGRMIITLEQNESSDLVESQVSVYDIAGRLMGQYNQNAYRGAQQEYDLTSLENGVYVIRVRVDGVDLGAQRLSIAR